MFPIIQIENTENTFGQLYTSIIPMGSISDKKSSVPRENISKYFIKIIVFSQLYRSKSATPEIAYNMKNRFLVMYDINNLKQQSSKTVRTYI